MDTYVGKNVLLVGSHPMAGETGMVREIKDTSMGFGYLVDFKNGTKCFILHHWNILKILDE